MAKAIFHSNFNYTDTKKGVSWKINPSKTPKSLPSEVIDAAIKAGAARPVTKKKKEVSENTSNE